MQWPKPCLKQSGYRSEPSAVMKERFTVQLAAVDCIPVLLFSASAIILAGKLGHPLFIIGACLCVCAGLGKVIWKLTLALKGKDLRILGAQLRYVMPVGFLLMIIGTIQSETAGQLLRQVIEIPCILYFIAAAIGMILMLICGKKFDRKDIRGNWIEEIINCVVQALVLVGVLLLL